MRLSRLFLQLYRWSLRRRSGRRGTEYEWSISTPLRTEYTSRDIYAGAGLRPAIRVLGEDTRKGSEGA